MESAMYMFLMGIPVAIMIGVAAVRHANGTLFDEVGNKWKVDVTKKEGSPYVLVSVPKEVAVAEDKTPAISSDGQKTDGQ